MSARDKRVWPQELINEVLLWRWEKKNPATNRPYTSDEIAAILVPKWSDITSHHISKIAIAGGHRRIREHSKATPLGKKYSADRRAAFYPGQKQDEPMSENLPAVPELKMIDGTPWADSRDMAKFFGKEHKHVLDVVRKAGCSDDFRRSNFRPVHLSNKIEGGYLSHILMTKDGFSGIGLGFTGPDAWRFKELYIAEFKRMEAHLRTAVSSSSSDLSLILNEMREDRREAREDRTEMMKILLALVQAKTTPSEKPTQQHTTSFTTFCQRHPGLWMKTFREDVAREGRIVHDLNGKWVCGPAADDDEPALLVDRLYPVPSTSGRDFISKYAVLTDAGVAYYDKIYRKRKSA